MRSKYFIPTNCNLKILTICHFDEPEVQIHFRKKFQKMV